MKFFIKFGVIVLFLIFAFSLNDVLACSPKPNWPPTFEQNYKSQKIAFVGIVKKVNEDVDSGTLDVDFQIIKAFKGLNGKKHVTIKTSNSDSVCGYNPNTFVLGDIWVIYALDDFTTDNLSLNKRFNSIVEAIKELDKASGMKKCQKGNYAVCGEINGENKTFSNKCELKDNGAVFVKDRACEFCSNENDPVCGEINLGHKCSTDKECPIVDKKTFRNKCLANRAGARNIVEGKCKKVIKVPTGNPIVNVKKNQIIKSPLIIKGNSNNVWFGFEGNLGTVELLTNDNKSLAKTGLKIKGEWMTEDPVDFEAKLEFDAGNAKEGKLVFKAENPSGELARQKSFEIPVKFISDSEESGGFWHWIVNFFKKIFN